MPFSVGKWAPDKRERAVNKKQSLPLPPSPFLSHVLSLLAPLAFLLFYVSIICLFLTLCLLVSK